MSILFSYFNSQVFLSIFTCFYPIVYNITSFIVTVPLVWRSFFAVGVVDVVNVVAIVAKNAVVWCSCCSLE